MKELFELAGGSVAGRDHRDAAKNCHDAHHFEIHPGIAVGVVCDGCGSGGHSEVGAKIGARIIVRQILRRFHDGPEAFAPAGVEKGLMRVRRSALGHIQLLADAMSGGFTETVEDYFLFTVVGFIMTREDTFVFRCGDGLVYVNDTAVTLTSADNKPDYLSYGIVDGTARASAFGVVSALKTGDVRSVLVGTDGACALAAAQDRKIAGREEKVGPISQFWREDAHFRNAFSIRRRLNVINRDSRRIDYERKTAVEEHGPLLDDTTIVVARRRK